MKYSNFKTKLANKAKMGSELYYDLLVTIIKNPDRYIGIFRLSNIKNKLVQNVTQSLEIKFGDFMEDIVTEYIDEMGYINLDKNIGTDEEGNYLSADQIFLDNENNIYLIEQKIRDDHDSTKKRGQFDNFEKKIECIRIEYPNKQLSASMWFIDNSLKKNKKYYNDRVKEAGLSKITHIYYGEELFENLFKRIDIWDEMLEYLKRNKRERGNDILVIPDFDTSDEILEALRRLKDEEPKLLKKLLSDKPKYEQLRAELFPNGINLKRI